MPYGVDCSMHSSLEEARATCIGSNSDPGFGHLRERLQYMHSKLGNSESGLNPGDRAVVDMLALAPHQFRLYSGPSPSRLGWRRAGDAIWPGKRLNPWAGFRSISTWLPSGSVRMALQGHAGSKFADHYQGGQENACNGPHVG